MNKLIRTNGGMPSLLSDFFDDDPFLNRMMLPKFNFDFLAKVPAANVVENTKNYVVELAAPGMQKKDFKVELENGNLCISSEKKEEKKESGEGFTRQEFNYNSFSRSFMLPENVMPDKIKANYENGILKIEIPKKEAAIKNGKKEVKVL